MELLESSWVRPRQARFQLVPFVPVGKEGWLQRLESKGPIDLYFSSIPTAPTINRVDSVALALSSADSWPQKAGVLVQSWSKARPNKERGRLPANRPFSLQNHCNAPAELDMRKVEQISHAVDQTAKEFGRIDILVNNAGIAPENLAENVCEEDFDATIAVNLKGTFFASQAVGRLMIRQKSGTIINMSSQAGFAALPTESIYCMTKAGIAHLTKCLAVEWGKYGITVNAVAPTFIRTPGTESALADTAFHADTLERIAALHRIGEPMEVAGAVVFLASSASSLITGETILIDGGWTAR
jgi:NAD(P)-dependent dehydrogenase (short-subunit alcohol dehydrogenase family)